ncbi:MAG: excisionase family DNA-binding protein [Alphaproteobacteria bacterium]|nr:excisionase family DNA-binding protein [Alphaproteobacteria bacterium]
MLSKPFLTTHEVAELLKVGEPTVRTWIHNLELRAVRLGREYRVAVKDLEAFVNEHETRPPSWEAEDDCPPGPASDPDQSPDPNPA